jgi:AraC-like DNA-binding protein
MSIFPNPADLLFFMTICLGLLVFSVLQFGTRYRGYSGRLLGIFCLSFSLFAAHNMLLNTGVMARVPQLFRITKPLHYLPAPLFYLYIRSMMRGTLRFDRRDSVHFLPVVLTFLDMLPFFQMDYGAKLDLVRQSMANNNSILFAAEGFLPKAVHMLATPLSIAVYLVISGRLVFGSRSCSYRDDLEQNRLVERWLRHFWALFLFFYVCWLGVLFFIPVFPWLNAFLAQTIFSAGMAVSVSSSLFFYPRILYGFQGDAPSPHPDIQQAVTNQPSTVPELSAARCQGYMETIDRSLREQKLYLNPDLRLTDLANATGLPYYLISATINQYHATNVNAYINAFRIAHVKQLMTAQDADQFTLEAIAATSGFGSRSTFIRVFKRSEGCPPSEFFKKISAKNN